MICWAALRIRVDQIIIPPPKQGKTSQTSSPRNFAKINTVRVRIRNVTKVFALKYHNWRVRLLHRFLDSASVLGNIRYAWSAALGVPKYPLYMGYQWPRTLIHNRSRQWRTPRFNITLQMMAFVSLYTRRSNGPTFPSFIAIFCLSTLLYFVLWHGVVGGKAER